MISGGPGMSCSEYPYLEHSREVRHLCQVGQPAALARDLTWWMPDVDHRERIAMLDRALEPLRGCVSLRTKRRRFVRCSTGALRPPRAPRHPETAGRGEASDEGGARGRGRAAAACSTERSRLQGAACDSARVPGDRHLQHLGGQLRHLSGSADLNPGTSISRRSRWKLY
jgi:hypothetical protein